MSPEKPIRSGKPAWASLAVLLALSVFLGLFVLPKLRPGRSRLVGITAPLFTLPVLDPAGSSSRIALKDLKGKAVVLDFWASWCGPCREQTAILNRVAARVKDQPVVIVGINTSDDPDDALRFLRSRSLAYASVLDESRDVAAAYDVKVLPTLVVVDTSGQISATHTSVLREREIESLIEQALSPPER